MIKGKLENGFEYEISETARDDWEIVEAIEEIEENPQKIVTVAKLLLGVDGYKNLKEACRVDGHISFTDMTTKVFEILQSCGEVKN